MVVDTGKILSHSEGMYSYMKKVVGDIKDSFDIVFLPPLTIKNALPCYLEIMGCVG